MESFSRVLLLKKEAGEAPDGLRLEGSKGLLLEEPPDKAPDGSRSVCWAAVAGLSEGIPG